MNIGVSSSEMFLFNAHHVYCVRNEALRKKGLNFPSAVKTGTTIAGIVFKVCTYLQVVLCSYSHTHATGWNFVGS